MTKGKGGLMAGLNAANERASAPAGGDVSIRFDKAEETLGLERTPAARAPRASRTTRERAPAKATQRRAVRSDGFTIPLDEYGTIAAVIGRAAGRVAGHRAVTKSLVVRAGLAALERMTDAELVDLISSLPEIKTGAPKREER